MSSEYTTSTRNVKALKAEKLELYEKDFPAAEVRALVRKHFKPEAFAGLEGGKNVFLVAPSTSGRNTIPIVFAKSLAKKYGGEVVAGWATPKAVLRTAKKGIVSKLKEPPRYEAVPGGPLDRLPRGANIYIVDDVVTTGQTITGLKEVLHRKGLSEKGVLSIGQSEKRLVSDRDIERISVKLGASEVTENKIREVLVKNELKHFANYIERAIPNESDKSASAESKREFLREYFSNEYDRLRESGQLVGNPEKRTRSSGQGAEALQSRPRSATGLQRTGTRERVRVQGSCDDERELGVRV